MSTMFYVKVPIAHRSGSGDHRVHWNWKMMLTELLPLLERSGATIVDETGFSYNREEFAEELGKMQVSGESFS